MTPINTTRGVVNVPLGEARHVNTSRILEPPEMVYEDEAPEVVHVLNAAGWAALIGDEAVHLVAFAALDSGRMYGVVVGEDGRIDLNADVESNQNFVRYARGETER